MIAAYSPTLDSHDLETLALNPDPTIAQPAAEELSRRFGWAGFARKDVQEEELFI
jgi:hypothetical protein